MPQSLCGWNPKCMPFQLPPNWPTGYVSNAGVTYHQGIWPPPYTSASAWGGGTLDKVRLTSTIYGNSVASDMGGAGGGLGVPALYQCPAGTTIVGFGWATEAASNWQYGTFAGLHSVGP